MSGFYHAYIWKLSDLERKTPTWSEWCWLWILPTYVQIGDGYAFFFKKTPLKYYFIKAEKLPKLNWEQLEKIHDDIENTQNSRGGK